MAAISFTRIPTTLVLLVQLESTTLSYSPSEISTVTGLFSGVIFQLPSYLMSNLPAIGVDSQTLLFALNDRNWDLWSCSIFGFVDDITKFNSTRSLSLASLSQRWN